MEEHLEIRNFGPIDELVIKDIESFTIFIGESASGKSTIIGKHILLDEKACNECKSKGKDICSLKKYQGTFVVRVEREVSKIEIEKFLKQFEGKQACPKHLCDLLFYDNNTKIVFVEMSCCLEKYSKNKLALARKQIEATIDKLKEVKTISVKIDGYANKMGIFAFRNKTISETNATKGMITFLKFSEKISGNNNLSSLLANGFIFKTVLYPTEYVL